MDITAPPGGDGLSWATAYNNPQTALGASSEGDDLWVAQGTYRPTSGTNRAIAFNLLPIRSIFGGFPTGGGDQTFGARNPQQFQTILSGDIGQQGVITDNSFHVVTAIDQTSSDRLDGFFIQLGNANGFGTFQSFGGGILIASNGGPGGPAGTDFGPTIVGCVIRNCQADILGGGVAVERANGQLRRCVVRDNFCVFGDGGGLGSQTGALKLVTTTFISNTSGSRGGGAYHTAGEFQMVNCSFFGNLANNNGGGVYSNTSATLTNCLFSGNIAPAEGGGLWSRSSTLINCTFSRNTATTFGGGVRIVPISGDATAVKNCILYRNSAAGQQSQTAQISFSGTLDIDFSCVQNLTGSFGGDGNTGNDPLFVDDDGPGGIVGTDDDNLRLNNCSPVRNRGSSVLVPPDSENVDDDTGPGSLTEPTPDLDLQNRIVGMAVDMGAYENLEICLADLNGDCRINSLDLGILLSAWSVPTGSEPGCQGAIPCCADLNGDGLVNSLDLGILLAAWTLSPPPPACDTHCGGGSMMMGGGGPSAPSLALPASLLAVQPAEEVPQFDLNPPLWLMTADIQDLWAWYVEMFGAPPGSDD